MSLSAARALKIAVVAGEHSGDQLGFKLMRALRAQAGREISFFGVGGAAMEAEGLQSLFPLEDIAVMGISAVIPRLPRLIARVFQTVREIISVNPDIFIIIDSPDFTHAVAKRVRKKLPVLSIVDYVSPSVWAWRSGRARKMRAYVDHVLALLPFEPAAHLRLGGPPCTYVGHPLIERRSELRPNPEEGARRMASPPLVLILPGSRGSEIQRLLPDFGAAMQIIAAAVGAVDFVLPAVPHLRGRIEEEVANWRIKPRIVDGEAAKYQTFRIARAALAASGTVTLELALAGVPMVVAYKVSKLEEQLKYVISASSIVLPNLILGGDDGEKPLPPVGRGWGGGLTDSGDLRDEGNAFAQIARPPPPSPPHKGEGGRLSVSINQSDTETTHPIPELLQRDCTPDSLAAAMIPLIRGGAVRDAQASALTRLDALMQLPNGETPSGRAARIVLETLKPRL